MLERLQSNIGAKCVAAAGAFFALLGVNLYYFDGAQLFSNSCLNLLLFALLFWLILKAAAVRDRSLHRLSLGYSALLSFGITFGKAIYLSNDVCYIFRKAELLARYLFTLFGLVILFYFGLKLILSRLALHRLKPDEKARGLLFADGKRGLLLCWGFIFLCWLPCYLAYYPGIYSYDIMGQTYQALGMSDFNRFQAIGHTFFVTLCYQIGTLLGGAIDADPSSPDATAQLVTYSVLQMLILSFAFALCVWYLSKRKLPLALRVTALLYFALNPINAIFSFIPTKDVLFTAFFVLLFVLLAELIRDPERYSRSIAWQACFVVDLLLLCFFRNNALYALLLFFPFLIFAYRKRCGLKILRTAVIFVCCFLIINGPVLTACGVKSGNVKEALSVPIQQLACTVKFKSDQLTDVQKATIAEILDYDSLADTYNPRFTDPVKDEFDTEQFANDPAKYAKLWAELFFQFPQEYLSAFFTLNVDYWYPDAAFPDRYSQRMYIETYINEQEAFPIVRDSKLPCLYPFYERFADGQMLQTVPVVSVFFSISTPIWLMLLCMVMLKAKRRARLCLILLPAVLMWLTFIAGPVSNLRYVYPILAAYPLYFALVAAPDRFLKSDG